MYELSPQVKAAVEQEVAATVVALLQDVRKRVDNTVQEARKQNVLLDANNLRHIEEEAVRQLTSVLQEGRKLVSAALQRAPTTVPPIAPANKKSAAARSKKA